ncbi:molybdopterin converting factor subunit 1 [Marinobacteraceae bacterium S3BR75-40.1]
MIRVLFFASLRERLQRESLTLEDAGNETVASLRDRVTEQLPAFAEVLASGRVLAAVNETMAGDGTPVRNNDTVAFFPPVTGG